MIAQPLPAEELAPAPRRSRSARHAAERRRARTSRLRYVVTTRIVAVVAAMTLVVVTYLGLVGNVERMNFELSHAEADRAKLVAQTEKLDDQIARLRSRERLAKIAAQLGMHESQTFAAIGVPVPLPKPAPAGLALLARLR